MENNEEIEKYLKDFYPESEITLFKNYDYSSAFIGISHDDRAIYSYELMLEYLVLNEDFTLEEAVEWVDYNTLRALPYMENSPIIMYGIIE